MYSGSRPASLPAQKFVDASASDEVTQEQPAGQSPTVSDPPSLHNAVSPSPPSAPQTPSQMVDDRSDPVFQKNHGERAGVDESQSTRLHTGSKETLQHPQPDADDSHSESDTVSPENRDGSARIDEGLNETSHAGPSVTLQDPPSHTDYDSSGSRTDLQDTPSSGNVSRVDVGDKGSGELSVRKLVFTVAEIGVGLDFNLNRGSDGNDEEQYQPKTRQDGPEASGMLPVSFSPTRTLHLWRFWSECRRRKLPRWSRSKLRCVHLSNYIPDVGDILDRHGSTARFIPESSGAVQQVQCVRFAYFTVIVEQMYQIP